MAQKKSTAEKAAPKATPKATPKAAPKAAPAAKKTPPPPKVAEISEMGLYPIKSVVGGLNIKGVPLPGKRVMLITPTGTKVVDNLTIVKTGDVYSLK